MKRTAAILALVALLAVGCESGPARTPQGSPTQPTVAASQRELDPIVLTADLEDRPAPWRLMAHIRFGARPRDVGLFNDRRHTSTPIYPPSFAVDADRSIWILDIVKHRIAHFSAQGHYLGRVAGVRFNRHTPLPVDIAFAGDTLYLLSHRTPVVGVLQSVSDAGVQRPETVVFRGNHPAIVTTLYPSRGSGPLGQVEGRASEDPVEFGTGRAGVAELRGPHGAVRFLPGYPLVDGTFMSLNAVRTSDRDLEVRYARKGERSVRPLHFRLLPGHGARAIPPIVQAEQDAGTLHGLIASVGVGPARSKDGEVGDGRWLLGVFDDGSPLIWERLPEQTLTPEWATRTLTATPDGTIYLMLAQPDGMSVYRRPSRP